MANSAIERLSEGVILNGLKCAGLAISCLNDLDR